MSPLPEIAVATVPFLVLAAGLAAARRRHVRRSAEIARQIALTDAIHRELGAVAAPLVQGGAGRAGWVVRMAVPLGHPALVAALARIAHELFHRLDGPGARVQIVLTDRATPPWPAARAAAAGRPAGDAEARRALRAA